MLNCYALVLNDLLLKLVSTNVANMVLKNFYQKEDS